MITDKTLDFDGKVAVITGAAQGMGRAVAERFAAGGSKLVLFDVNAQEVEQASIALQSKGADCIAISGSVIIKSDVDSIVSAALDKYGAINILVNNAGVLRPTPVVDIEEDEWDWVIGVNLKGTYMCSRAVLKPMKEFGWGRIINFSSTAGKNISTVGGAHYTSAKAGILGFTRHLAKESAKYGITVNSVCPGLIDTEMVRLTISKEKQQMYADSFPITRLGEPWEVAELVAFLASDRAAYMTGASLDINGGDLMI